MRQKRTDGKPPLTMFFRRGSTAAELTATAAGCAGLERNRNANAADIPAIRAATNGLAELLGRIEKRRKNRLSTTSSGLAVRCLDTQMGEQPTLPNPRRNPRMASRSKETELFIPNPSFVPRSAASRSSHEFRS